MDSPRQGVYISGNTANLLSSWLSLKMTTYYLSSFQRPVLAYTTDGLTQDSGFYHSFGQILIDLRALESTCHTGCVSQYQITYARKNKIDFEVIEPKQRKIVKKSYADNFLN